MTQNKDRPPPRDAGAIFEDLRSLAQADGALHYLSSIFYRDWVLKIDTHEAKVVDDDGRRWSSDKLNNNEVMLFIGLMVQAASDRIYIVASSDDACTKQIDALMREFHDRVLEDARAGLDLSDTSTFQNPSTFGPMSKEAIYYGADGFYMHQFETFSRHRYRNDGDWLLQNVGISIRPMLEIARFIVDRINFQITATIYFSEESGTLEPTEMTNSMIMPKADLNRKFGKKADTFLSM